MIKINPGQVFKGRAHIFQTTCCIQFEFSECAKKPLLYTIIRNPLLPKANYNESHVTHIKWLRYSIPAFKQYNICSAKKFCTGKFCLDQEWFPSYVSFLAVDLDRSAN